MKIGELAKISGVAAHTIRFYESEGLLKNVPRGDNGYRKYGETELDTLYRIQVGQKLGLSLQELKLMCHHHDEWDKDKMIQQLHNKLNDVRGLQKTLAAQEQSLQLIINSLESGETDCQQRDQLLATLNSQLHDA
ncbi:MerR family transcriptional regulator [uncultured Pseudoteredinibacter sp.]|uniref:MerR family transcriptional regulator n=1 Tax=uncultured Pseudoteredinibacter sp. TaxID=1641701 RepID=UPI002614F605|nr:MerR family transcriptional regulator [uncultured Pseudoteredinibacter sp.]